VLVDAALEHAPDGRLRADQVKCQLRMAWDIPVAHQHRDVRGDPLGA
jgi:hypothetical protein